MLPAVAAATGPMGTEMPQQISSYRLESELARGGMGIVYRGVHTFFEEIVAILEADLGRAQRVGPRPRLQP